MANSSNATEAPTCNHMQVVEVYQVPYLLLTCVSAVMFALGLVVGFLVGKIIVQKGMLEPPEICHVDEPELSGAEPKCSYACGPRLGSEQSRFGSGPRSVFVQAQVTYTRKWAQPRFRVLPDVSHGAWAE